MIKKLIVTVGPSLLTKNKIKQIHQPYYIYRINGAHGNLKNIELMIEEVRQQIPDAEILIDLPGNKIRTSQIDEPIVVEEGKPFYLNFNQFNFSNFYQYLKIGDHVSACDSTLQFIIEEVQNNSIKLKSLNNGVLGNNKGFHISGVSSKLPFLFEKDLKLIELGNLVKVSYFGLSFVRDASDVIETKAFIKSPSCIIKIETMAAISNLDKILDTNDLFLIDRGDLSTEIGLLNLARYQKFIIDEIAKKNKKVFLATQFLKNMENNSIPSISEAIDLMNTLSIGVYGLQLSEETAIGKYPVECLHLIKDALSISEISLNT